MVRYCASEANEFCADIYAAIKIEACAELHLVGLAGAGLAGAGLIGADFAEVDWLSLAFKRSAWLPPNLQAHTDSSDCVAQCDQYKAHRQHFV